MDDPRDPLEAVNRLRTINEIFREGRWLTAERLEKARGAESVREWKRRSEIFGVSHAGREYFATYQFDANLRPLPIIKEILAVYGEVADPWKVAAWFHFPNAWLVRRVDGAPRSVAPRDLLDQGSEVLRAASKRRGTYVA